MDTTGEIDAIDAMAKLEATHWFAWANLAMVAFEYAGHDRDAAVSLLQEAIDELKQCNGERLPQARV